MSAEPSLTIKGEFAHVSVTLDQTANGTRLLLVDEMGGSRRYADPLELECFTRADTSVFDRYLPYEPHSLDTR